jgi:hypothetical protein
MANDSAAASSCHWKRKSEDERNRYRITGGVGVGFVLGLGFGVDLGVGFGPLQALAASTLEP